MTTVAYATDRQNHTYSLVQKGSQFKWFSGSFALTTVPAFASRDEAIKHVERLGWEVWS